MNTNRINELLDILQCPLSKEKLIVSDDYSYLYSSSKKYLIRDNCIDFCDHSSETQLQTAEMFASKWKDVSKIEHDKAEERQKAWYLDLYGFESEDALAQYLRKRKVIVDTGAGRGYKAAWFATLAPKSIVLAVEISESVYAAAARYVYPNLFFIRGDIGNIPINEEVVDYISCDQVIHHTTDPRQTFNILCGKLKKGGEFSCYVYRKKALPRELLDEDFRSRSQNMTKDEIMKMSAQLTELGKRLHSLNLEFDCPEIPALGIKGGRTSIQRFLYWNFIKCFWNEELGEELSTLCNFDWYAPSQASRHSKEEYLAWIYENKLEIIHFHEEEACFSGRFKKTNK